MRGVHPVLLAFLAVACGGSTGTSAETHPAASDAAIDVGTDVGTSGCVPGESIACGCTDGTTGAQVCSTDGGYAACVCAAPDAGPSACVPGQMIGCACTNGSSGAQTCLGDGTYGPCACDVVTPAAKLKWLQAGIVGTWAGTVSNPWQPSFQATVVFEASGHYSAHSPGDTSIVFYYGTNQDEPEKTYDLVDVKANDEGYGEIVIYFGPGNTELDEIRHLVLSPDQTELSFETWHQSVYGPISLTLTRQK